LYYFSFQNYFQFNIDSGILSIQHIPSIFPTKVIKFQNIDGSINYQILIQTIAALPQRSNVEDSNFEQCVWSPHFNVYFISFDYLQWILDDRKIFNDERVVSNTLYVTWIEVMKEPLSSDNNVLTRTVEIIRPEINLLDINDMVKLIFSILYIYCLYVVDLPLADEQGPASTQPGSAHALAYEYNPKKINLAAVYTGLVIGYVAVNGQRNLALWSLATGILHFYHSQSKNIAIGTWLDFSVRNGQKKVEVFKLKYAVNAVLPTKSVGSRVQFGFISSLVLKAELQVCEKIRLPETLPDENWVWMSGVVGKVTMNVKKFKDYVKDHWDELAGKVRHVWLSYSVSNSNLSWKFESFASPNEFVSLPVAYGC
uniref:DUF5683 domain-containing protein n=1 Tax=Thelazia callipaeda TaxID=103827 RepID=A0A0N5CRG0_THECL